jgi:hypothetical protein
MDYIDPAPIPPRDEPIKPLSPEEVEIAALKYQANVLNHLNTILAGLPSTYLPPYNEKDKSRFN